MNRLKDLRDDNDLSQAKIAEILGTTRSAISNYELEVRELSLNNLRTLSKYFKTSIDYILYRTDIRNSYKEINDDINGNTNRLKWLRQRERKTQKQVSIDLNIPLKTYIKYENMSRSLNIQMLSIFADYYHTSTDYIIFNTDEDKPHKKSIVDWNNYNVN